MDINNLKPGSELDILIAKTLNMDFMEHNGVLWKDDPAIYEWATPWNPSTKIECAWDVVDAIRSDMIGDENYSLMLVDDRFEDGRYAYGCRFTRDGNFTLSSSMSLAICLSALKLKKGLR